MRTLKDNLPLPIPLHYLKYHVSYKIGNKIFKGKVIDINFSSNYFFLVEFDKCDRRFHDGGGMPNIYSENTLGKGKDGYCYYLSPNDINATFFLPLAMMMKELGL